MQSQFRGHRVRLERAKAFAREQDAATKLQSRYRGYQTRRGLNTGAQPRVKEAKTEVETPDESQTNEKKEEPFDFMRNPTMESSDDQKNVTVDAPHTRGDDVPDDALSDIQDDDDNDEADKTAQEKTAVENLMDQSAGAEMPGLV